MASPARAPLDARADGGHETIRYPGVRAAPARPDGSDSQSLRDISRPDLSTDASAGARLMAYNPWDNPYGIDPTDTGLNSPIQTNSASTASAFTPGQGFTNTAAQPFKGPSGIPDPNYPGYDTNGFKLGSTYDPK